MRLASVFPAIVVLFIIVGSILVINGQNTTVERCSEFNLRTSPTFRTTLIGLNGKFTDRCDSNGNLIEYYCKGDTVDFINVYCGGKCVNGACPTYLKCQLNQPTNRTIILRMDDVQDSWSIITINVINSILNRNMSVTLGVIPSRIGQDSLMKDYILTKINDTRILVAQHGTYHADNEFAYLNETEAYDLAQIGFNMMVNNFHIKPVIFIPPENVYNAAMSNAIFKLGFKLISSGNNEYGFDGDLVDIGANVVTKGAFSRELVSTNDILNTCNYYLNLRNVCVVLIHPQDFLDNQQGGLNETKYMQFTNTLDALQNLNATFATFQQMLQCS